MESTAQFSHTIDELLAPLEQAVAACADGISNLEGIRQHCRRAAEMLRESSEADAARAVTTFGQLLELAEVLRGSDDELSTGHREEMLQFLTSGLQTLRDALTGADGECLGQLSTVTDTALDRWGELLQLVSDDECDLARSYADDPSDDSQAPEDCTDQVDLILAALSHAGAQQSASEGRVTSSTGHDTMHASGTDEWEPALPSRPVESALLNPELLEAYLEDAGKCLGAMERGILDFENGQDKEAPIEQLCRELHTLKGASASVGLDSLASQLHNVEEQLQYQKPGFAGAPMDVVMDCVDAVRRQIGILRGGTASRRSPEDAPEALHRSMAWQRGEQATDGVDSMRVRTVQLDRLMNLLADVVMWRSRREKCVNDLDAADDELTRCLIRLQAVGEHQRQPVPHRPATGAGRGDPRTKYVAELMTDLREITQTLRQSRQVLADENRAVSKFIQQFRQELVQIRRMPLAGLFQRLHRSIREAARIEGKQVHLEVRGEELGLERSLQEQLYEPLLHLVRNAVSHGIESPADRVKAGKPPVGTVSLAAYGSPHVLIFEVRDDGRGLDYDAIRRRGIERGLIDADRPVSESHLARLIFRPGFSTRESTNEVSGRGVGMNVVEEALNRSQCHLETESEPHRGTTFRITIPLRSVIEHALLFRCGGQSFGIPMQFVRSASQEGQHQHEPSSSAETTSLADLLGLPAAGDCDAMQWIDIADQFGAPTTAGRAKAPTVDHQMRMSVDDILGPEEVVVRALPPLLRRHPHVCGMTLSGSGEVVLLLDGRRLLRDAATRDRERPSPSQVTEATSNGQRAARQTHVLVVDDSLSARRRLVQKLRRHGFQIAEAADGLEAIDRLRTESFDAVFSDLEMPHLGGFDLLTELSDMDRPSPPCVIVTTRNDPDTQTRAEALGAAAFLSKPVDDSSVNEVVSRLTLKSLPTTNGDA